MTPLTRVATVTAVFTPPTWGPSPDLSAVAADYAARVRAAVEANDFGLVPLNPWGPPLAALLPAASGVQLPPVRRAPLFVRAAKPVISREAEETDGTGGEDEEPVGLPPLPPPEFPGSDGSTCDYVEWLAFWMRIKPKLPKDTDPQDLTYDDIKKYARDFLIQQGIDQLGKKLKEWLKDAVRDWAGRAAAVAGASGLNDTGWYDKILTALSDPIKAITELMPSLSKLGGMGVDQVFSLLGWKDPESAEGLIAIALAKGVIKEVVDSLLDKVTSLADLEANFGNLQDKLYKKIDEFLNGRPFVPGTAIQPIIRQFDLDSRGNMVTTGTPKVVAEGMLVARVTDGLFPEMGLVQIGSQKVTAAGLPVARTTSGTSVGSQLSMRAATVFVEGHTFAAVTAGGAPYSPVDTGLTGGMSVPPPAGGPMCSAASPGQPAAGAEAGGQAGQSGPTAENGAGKPAADTKPKTEPTPAEAPATPPGTDSEAASPPPTDGAPGTGESAADVGTGAGDVNPSTEPTAPQTENEKVLDTVRQKLDEQPERYGTSVDPDGDGPLRADGNKCNLYVHDVLKENGYDDTEFERFSRSNLEYQTLPRTAGQYGNPDETIRDLPVVTDPKPGDVVAWRRPDGDGGGFLEWLTGSSYSGHTGIVSGDGKYISVSSNTHDLQETDIDKTTAGFRTDPVYRRPSKSAK